MLRRHHSTRYCVMNPLMSMLMSKIPGESHKQDFGNIKASNQGVQENHSLHQHSPVSNASNPDSQVSNPDSLSESLIGASQRVPKCARCRCHGINCDLKGHKEKCQFKDCKCRSCMLVVERQKITATRVAHLRHQRKIDKQRSSGYYPNYPLTEEEEYVLTRYVDPAQTRIGPQRMFSYDYDQYQHIDGRPYKIPPVRFNGYDDHRGVYRPYRDNYQSGSREFYERQKVSPGKMECCIPWNNRRVSESPYTQHKSHDDAPKRPKIEKEDAFERKVYEHVDDQGGAREEALRKRSLYMQAVREREAQSSVMGEKLVRRNNISGYYSNPTRETEIEHESEVEVDVENVHWDEGVSEGRSENETKVYFRTQKHEHNFNDNNNKDHNVLLRHDGKSEENMENKLMMNAKYNSHYHGNSINGNDTNAFRNNESRSNNNNNNRNIPCSGNDSSGIERTNKINQEMNGNHDSDHGNERVVKDNRNSKEFSKDELKRQRDEFIRGKCGEVLSVMFPDFDGALIRQTAKQSGFDIQLAVERLLDLKRKLHNSERNSAFSVFSSYYHARDQDNMKESCRCCSERSPLTPIKDRPTLIPMPEKPLTAGPMTAQPTMVSFSERSGLIPSHEVKGHIDMSRIISLDDRSKRHYFEVENANGRHLSV